MVEGLLLLLVDCVLIFAVAVALVYAKSIAMTRQSPDLRSLYIGGSGQKTIRWSGAT